MGANAPDQPGRDNQSPPTDTFLTRQFDSLVRNITVMPPRIENPLPLEPVFDAATDLRAGLLVARPKLYRLEDYFGYSARELEHCASKVGVSSPVKLLSKTGVRKFRRLVRQFREQGLVVSEKNPDRDAARGCTYHSRFLYDFMSDSTVLEYFSRVAGIELIPLPIRYNQIQINMLPAYDPDTEEPGFGTHIDSTNFACVLDITEDRDMEGGALQHAFMTREQFFVRSGSRGNVAYAYLHMVLPQNELLTTRFTEEGSAVFQQGSLVPHQVENVRKVHGTRDTVAFTLHPANPMVRRFDFFSAASTWNSRGIKEDIGNLLVELADKRIEAINGALGLVEDLADTADAIRPEQLRELRTGLQNSEQLKRAVEQFLVDFANGIDGISCPDDTFETPSVFDVSYKG
jgi:hypothetical protein